LGKTDELSKTYHFIYMDIVAFSDPRIYAIEQLEKITQLNKIVKDSRTFSESNPNRRVIKATGDGMVIGFGESCEQPYNLACEIHKALNEYNKDKEDRHQIKLRIGLHTGAVFEGLDITGDRDVWGPGIIFAQRVMNEGRDGHILATDGIANELKKLRPEIDRMIKEVGPREVKHGEILNIYNIFDESEGIGNPSAPFLKRHKLTVGSYPIQGIPFTVSGPPITCPDCGAEIPADSKFCNKCGYKL